MWFSHGLFVVKSYTQKGFKNKGEIFLCHSERNTVERIISSNFHVHIIDSSVVPIVIGTPSE